MQTYSRGEQGRDQSGGTGEACGEKLDLSPKADGREAVRSWVIRGMFRPTTASRKRRQLAKFDAGSGAHEVASLLAVDPDGSGVKVVEQKGGEGGQIADQAARRVTSAGGCRSTAVWSGGSRSDVSAVPVARADRRLCLLPTIRGERSAHVELILRESALIVSSDVTSVPFTGFDELPLSHDDFFERQWHFHGGAPC